VNARSKVTFWSKYSSQIIFPTIASSSSVIQTITALASPYFLGAFSICFADSQIASLAGPTIADR
jgi:hypothetical protein